VRENGRDCGLLLVLWWPGLLWVRTAITTIFGTKLYSAPGEYGERLISYLAACVVMDHPVLVLPRSVKTGVIRIVGYSAIDSLYGGMAFAEWGWVSGLVFSAFHLFQCALYIGYFLTIVLLWYL
jgi:hypothetical protein